MADEAGKVPCGSRYWNRAAVKGRPRSPCPCRGDVGKCNFTLQLVSRTGQTYTTSDGIEILGLPSSYGALSLPVTLRLSFGRSYDIGIRLLQTLRVCEPIVTDEAYYIITGGGSGDNIVVELGSGGTGSCGNFYTDSTGLRYYHLPEDIPGSFAITITYIGAVVLPDCGEVWQTLTILDLFGAGTRQIYRQYAPQ